MASKNLETVIADDAWSAALPHARDLAERVYAAAVARDPALNGSVALLLADDAALRDLNGRFRGKDSATNVLSFPSGAPAPGFLGDIALAFETCGREADAQRKPLADHAAHLIVHGLLHLVGYNHETEDEALVMEGKEAEILAALGIEDPYSEN